MDWVKIDTTVWNVGSPASRGNAITVFNRGRQPNRSASKLTCPQTTVAGYVFETNQASADYWTNRDIIEHSSLAFPEDSSATATIKFGIQNLTNVFTLNFRRNGRRGAYSPERYKPFCESTKPLVLVLTLHAWRRSTDRSVDAAIVIESISDVAITLPSGSTQPAAANFIAIQADADPLTTVVLSDTGVQVVDQVRVRGARKQYVFSTKLTDSSAVAQASTQSFLCVHGAMGTNPQLSPVLQGKPATVH